MRLIEHYESHNRLKPQNPNAIKLSHKLWKESLKDYRKISAIWHGLHLKLQIKKARKQIEKQGGVKPLPTGVIAMPESKNVSLGKIPYKGYKRPKCPEGLSLNQWAKKVFKPNPKYKDPYPKWQFYARIKRKTERGLVYICLPFLAFNREALDKQVVGYCKATKNTKVLKVWRDKPVSWDGFKNVPWHPEYVKKEEKQYARKGVYKKYE